MRGVGGRDDGHITRIFSIGRQKLMKISLIAIEVKLLLLPIPGVPILWPIVSCIGQKASDGTT